MVTDHKGRGDSVILTFHLPSLEDRDYVISIVYSPEKYPKMGTSWHGGIKPIISQMGKLELSV